MQQSPQQPYPQPAYQPPLRPVKTKKSFPWLWILALVLVFFGGYGIGHAGTAPDTTIPSTQATQPATSATQAAQPTAKPTQAPKWTTTHNFKGNGAKKTETFPVPDSWKLVWTCTSGSFDGILTAIVYNSDSTIHDTGINSTCKAGKTVSDTTEEHQAGNVYLDVNAVGDWTIQVQEMK